MSTMILAELKLRGQLSWPASLDTYYQSLLDAAEDACLAECGIDKGSCTEYFDGGHRAYFLTFGPVSGITSVEVNGTALASADYRQEGRGSRLVILKETALGVGNLKVVYSCGFTETELFKHAVAMTVQQIAKLQSSKQVAVINRTTEGGTEQLDQNLIPLAAKTALNKYKRGFIL